MIDTFVARAQHRLKLRYGQRHPGGQRLWMPLLLRLCKYIRMEHQEIVS